MEAGGTYPECDTEALAFEIGDYVSTYRNLYRLLILSRKSENRVIVRFSLYSVLFHVPLVGSVSPRNGQHGLVSHYGLLIRSLLTLVLS